MELVERYLQAIEFWLPKAQKADIIAELSEDLRSEIEEREEALDRRLSEPELERLLEARGHPLLVANRYMPQRMLIGPVLFPMYVFVLKMLAIGFLPAVFGLIAQLADLPPAEWIHTTLSYAGAAWQMAFAIAGATTLAFAVLERTNVPDKLLLKWKVKQLPRLQAKSAIPRLSSLFELGVGVVGLLWWSVQGWSPNFAGIRVEFNPVWINFYIGYWLLMVGNIAMSTVNLIYPNWTRLRAIWKLQLDAIGGIMFCWLLKVDVVAAVRVGPMDFTQQMQWWMEHAFPWSIVIVLAVLAGDVYRIFRQDSTAERISAALGHSG